MICTCLPSNARRARWFLSGSFCSKMVYYAGNCVHQPCVSPCTTHVGESRKLLQVLWAGREDDAIHLETLCVKFGLFIPLNPADESLSGQQEEKFLVPSLLPLKNVTEPTDSMAPGVEPLMCYFLFSIDSNLMRRSTVGSTRLCDGNFRFLPTGLFAHIIGQVTLRRVKCSLYRI